MEVAKAPQSCNPIDPSVAASGRFKTMPRAQCVLRQCGKPVTHFGENRPAVSWVRQGGEQAPHPHSPSCFSSETLAGAQAHTAAAACLAQRVDLAASAARSLPTAWSGAALDQWKGATSTARHWRVPFRPCRPYPPPRSSSRSPAARQARWSRSFSRRADKKPRSSDGRCDVASHLSRN